MQALPLGPVSPGFPSVTWVVLTLPTVGCQDVLDKIPPPLHTIASASGSSGIFISQGPREHRWPLVPPRKPRAWAVANDRLAPHRGPGQTSSLDAETSTACPNEPPLRENLSEGTRVWMCAASVCWFGEGVKKTQRYNPELPVLQGPALHIFVKHVCHVIELAPGDRDSCGWEQLLAGAERTGRVRKFGAAGGKFGPQGPQWAWPARCRVTTGPRGGLGRGG